MITLHGANLADYGGAVCRFGFAAAAAALGGGNSANGGGGAAAIEDLVTNATISAGSGVGGGAVRCAAQGRRAPAGPG